MQVHPDIRLAPFGFSCPNPVSIVVRLFKNEIWDWYSKYLPIFQSNELWHCYKKTWTYYSIYWKSQNRKFRISGHSKAFLATPWHLCFSFLCFSNTSDSSGREIHFPWTTFPRIASKNNLHSKSNLLIFGGDSKNLQQNYRAFGAIYSWKWFL